MFFKCWQWKECKGGVSRMREANGLVGGRALGRLEGGR